MAGSTNITYMIDFNHKEFKNIEEMFEKFSDALTKHLEPTVKSMTNSLEKVKNVSYTTMEYSKSQNTGYKVNSNGYYINKDIAMKMQTEHPRVYNKMLREMQEYADNLAKENKAYRERRSEERKRDQELKQDRINESKARRQFEMDKANGLYGGDQRFVKTGFYGMRGNAIRILEKYGKRGESLGGIGGALVSSLNFRAGDPNSFVSKINSFINSSLFKGGLKAGTAANVVGGFATGAVVATRAITKFSNAAIKASEDIEVLTAQLGVVVGNTAQAGDLFTQIKNYALKSPFSVEQSTGATVLLRQSGVLQSDLIETMNMLGDLSMGDREKFNRIAANYAQILAAGKANAKDLKEFANAGIPVFKEIANYFGKQTTAEVRKLTEEGKVTSSVITQVFKNLTGEGGNFYGSTQKYANTYKGKRLNTEDEIKTKLSDYGNFGLARLGKEITLATKQGIVAGLNVFDADYRSVKNLYKDAKGANLGDDVLNGYLYQAVLTKGKFKKGRDKIVSDSIYEAMSKEERKEYQSLSDFSRDNEINFGKIAKNFGVDVSKVKNAFFKALAEEFTQAGSDYFERLFQDDKSFAFRLNTARANFDDNSNLKKIEKEIEERSKFETLLREYDELSKYFYAEDGVVKNFRFLNFDKMYEVMSSGVLTNSGKLSMDPKDYFIDTNKDASKNIIEIQRAFDSVSHAFIDGLSKMSEEPELKGLAEDFDTLSESVKNLNVYSKESASEFTNSVGVINTTLSSLLTESNLSEGGKVFVQKFKDMIERAFLTYTLSERPKDLYEPLQRRIFRSIAKTDERFGQKESLNEIDRKATKNIGTTLMNNLLKTRTLKEIQDKFVYKNDELNSEGAFNVDWQKTTGNLAKEQMNIHMIVHQLGGDLSVAVQNLEAYNKSVSSQIDVYTNLESTLKASEDDLSSAFHNMDKAQQTAFTEIGKVVSPTGVQAKRLRMNEGRLEALTATPKGEEWVDAIDKGFKIASNGLLDAIHDQKKTLMLLNNNIQINSAVLGTIKNLRDSSNQRRISQRFRNSGYFEKNGFVADKDSEFYNTFINTFSDLYMKLMNIDLSDMPKNPQEYEEYARRKTGGRFNFQQLKDLRNLQFSADTFDDSKIVEIFEKILGKTTLDDILRELKRNQNTFDDVPRWEQVFANLSGLPLSYITNKGKGNIIADAFGQLQSRDVLAATMRGYASTGANMSMISNLGVKNGERYDWKKSQDNITALMRNGRLTSGARSGLLSGLQSSRDSLITLATALLTTTDNQTDKNKSVTDVLQNYFVGSYLKGTIKDGDKERKIELEQRKDEATGLYNFFEKGTENLINTLDENFAFEKENTTQVVDKLMLVNNSAIAMVSALDNLASNIESLQDEISASRVGRFTGNVNFLKRNEDINSYLTGTGNQFLGTTANGTYLQAFTEAYGKVQENFISNILEIEKMTRDVDLEKEGDLLKYNEENKTSYNTSYIENARLLKDYIDSHKSVETIVEVLKKLGFTEDEVAKVAKEMAAEKVYSDRENTYQSLISQIPALMDYDLSEKGKLIANIQRDGAGGRFWTRSLGLSGNKQDIIDSIFYGENGGDATITERARKDAKEKLRKSLGLEINQDLQDNLLDSLKDFSINSFADSWQHAGKGIRETVEAITNGSEAWKDFGKSFVGSVKQLTANMGDLMAAAGLKQLIAGNYAVGAALLVASGMSQLVSGFLDPKDDNETDKKIETLKALKSDLKELIAQAKADAIYYEKEVSHKKALTTSQSMSVNDAIITPSGNVINTHPDDWLIATKTPQTLGNNKSSAPVVNLNIVNNSGQQLSVKKTQTSSNGEINIEAIIEGVVGKGIAEGKFDNALTTRDMRNAGRNVYM